MLTLCIPFALGFICTLVFVKETGGKSMDELSAEASGDLGDTGTSKFIIMMIIVAFLALMCIVFPLLPAGTFGVVREDRYGTAAHGDRHAAPVPVLLHLRRPAGPQEGLTSLASLA